MEIVFAFPFSYQHQERMLRRALQLKLAAHYDNQPAHKPNDITWEVWSWDIEQLCRELNVTVRVDEAAGQVIVVRGGS